MKRRVKLQLFLAFAVAMAPADLLARDITFAAPKEVVFGASSGETANGIHSGDFNGDGYTDYAVDVIDLNGNHRLVVLLGDGAGQFTIVNVPNAPTQFQSFLVADFNGDGKDDIVTLQGGCDTTYDDCTNAPDAAFTVLTGDGTGHFTVGDAYGLGIGTVSGILGDFNKDGKEDIIVWNTPPAFSEPALQTLFINRGDGSFATSNLPSMNSVDGEGPNSIVAGDFNGDGNLDLAYYTFGTFSPTAIFTLHGNGDGTFAKPQLAYNVDSDAFGSMRAADLNGDGKTDLLISLFPREANSANVPGALPRVATLLAKHAGGFYWASALSSPIYPTPGYIFPLNILVSDLNGDGKPDLVAFEDYTDSMGVAHESASFSPNLGGGTFGTRYPIVLKGAQQPAARAIAPLKQGDLPSLMIGDGGVLELLVNTTH
jgi:hypothetical protein